MQRFHILKPLIMGIAITALVLSTGGLSPAATREFLIVTGEIEWAAKPGEDKVADRNRGPVAKMERYTFHPGFLVVNRGDTVVLKVHNLKGSEHDVNIPDFGVVDIRTKRGQERTITFVADKAGTFQIICKKHDKPETEGPMTAYLYVLP